MIRPLRKSLLKTPLVSQNLFFPFVKLKSQLSITKTIATSCMKAEVAAEHDQTSPL